MVSQEKITKRFLEREMLDTGRPVGMILREYRSCNVCGKELTHEDFSYICLKCVKKNL